MNGFLGSFNPITAVELTAASALVGFGLGWALITLTVMGTFWLGPTRAEHEASRRMVLRILPWEIGIVTILILWIRFIHFHDQNGSVGNGWMWVLLWSILFLICSSW